MCLDLFLFWCVCVSFAVGLCSKELMKSGEMPEHCLKDRRAHKYGLLVSGIVAVVNMATAYLVTALLIRTPLKKD